MRHSTLLALTIAAQACTAVEPEPSFTTSDSAGVTIVQNSRPLWDGAGPWRVVEHPTLSIGSAEGPEENQLYRVIDATRLEDGRIAIANLGSHEVRFYDADGRFRSASGGEGRGPGEFSSMGLLWIARDSLLVYDLNSGMRISVFTLDGEFVRSFVLDRTTDGRFVVPVDLFSNGRVLTLVARRDQEISSGLALDTALLLTYTPEGRLADTLGWFPEDERYLVKQVDIVASTRRPFGLAAQRAMWGERMYFGSSATYEIGLYAMDGTLERLIRAPLANPPVTAAERAEYERRQLENRSRTAPIWREIQRQIELPDTKPAYGKLLVDAAGNLWVADYAREREQLNHWNVFDADGRWLGPVDTPAAMIVYEIGRDYVLGLWQDDLEIEYVRLHELVKEPA